MPARRRRRGEASRFSVLWAACEPSPAGFHTADRALHDRLIAAHPVRFGAVQSVAYPASMLEEKLAIAKVPPDDAGPVRMRQVFLEHPDWWLVITMVEVPA